MDVRCCLLHRQFVDPVVGDLVGEVPKVVVLAFDELREPRGVARDLGGLAAPVVLGVVASLGGRVQADRDTRPPPGRVVGVRRLLAVSLAFLEAPLLVVHVDDRAGAGAVGDDALVNAGAAVVVRELVLAAVIRIDLTRRYIHESLGVTLRVGPQLEAPEAVVLVRGGAGHVGLAVDGAVGRLFRNPAERVVLRVTDAVAAGRSRHGCWPGRRVRHPGMLRVVAQNVVRPPLLSDGVAPLRRVRRLPDQVPPAAIDVRDVCAIGIGRARPLPGPVVRVTVDDVVAVAFLLRHTAIDRRVDGDPLLRDVPPIVVFVLERSRPVRIRRRFAEAPPVMSVCRNCLAGIRGIRRAGRFGHDVACEVARPRGYLVLLTVRDASVEGALGLGVRSLLIDAPQLVVLIRKSRDEVVCARGIVAHRPHGDITGHRVVIVDGVGIPGPGFDGTLRY